ncbi:MAG: hypothetical protein ACXW5U_01250 [Thermoanaerobaculia bacterium]
MSRDQHNRLPNAADVAAAVDGFPDAVVEFAGGVPRSLLADTLRRYPDRGLYRFGDQLILLGGLVLAAAYVDSALRDGDVRGDHYRNFISTTLFGRGYSRGMASAFFQKARQVSGGEIAGLVRDDRVITAYTQSRRQNAGNTFRARIQHPLEVEVSALVKALRFFEELSFHGDGSVMFRGKPLDVWPFLQWDGQTLLRFSTPKDRLQNQLPEAMEWLDGRASEPRVVRLTFEQQSRLKRLGALVGYSIKRRTLRIEIPHAESVIPLLTDTHPQMSDLAELLREKAEDNTIAEKWLLPFLRTERGPDITIEDAIAELGNTILVDNAIIRRCLEKDPITVVTEYLIREPGDALDCMRRLTSRDEADKLYAQVERRASGLRKRLNPLFPYEDHRELLDKRHNEYRAELAAREIARLLKFRIVDQDAHESIDDYIERVSAFAEYVDDPDANSGKIAWGLFKCAPILHDVLRFVIQFYTAITYYDPRWEDGVGQRKRPELASKLAKIRNAPFGQAIDHFQALGARDDVTRSVAEHLGRDLWDRAKCERFTIFLHSFRKWTRNREAHEQEELPEGVDARSDLSQILEFLRWLQRPTDDDAHRERIYPAVLHLNVITTNQCGVTSVRYGLSERATPHAKPVIAPITLYTQQPLGHLAGVFYGLPNQDKSQRRLWIDPILIPTNVFAKEA